MGEIIASFLFGCLMVYLINNKKEKAADESKVLAKLDELLKQFNYHKHYIDSQQHLKKANHELHDTKEKLKHANKLLSDIRDNVSKAIKNK